MINKQYEKNKEKILKKLSEKYIEDIEFREKIKKSNLDRYYSDADYREKTKSRARERYRIKRKNIENQQSGQK
jgi:hypothetical protein